MEGGTEFFHQHLGKAADMAQRRPQVMRHRVTERFQFFVGSFQLGRPLFNPLFEFVIEFPDFLLSLLALRDLGLQGRCPLLHALF